MNLGEYSPYSYQTNSELSNDGILDINSSFPRSGFQDRCYINLDFENEKNYTAVPSWYDSYSSGNLIVGPSENDMDGYIPENKKGTVKYTD